MKKLLLLITVVFCCNAGHAQQDAFCRSLDTLLKDAAHNFTTSRDSMSFINEQGVAWECKTKVPGVIAARILSVMGLYYEGALFQSKNIEEIKAAYQKYKSIVGACLAPKNFEVSYAPNFTKGIEDLTKVVYMPPLPDSDDDMAAPPHVALEVGYYKEEKTYTIILYVFGTRR